MNMGSHKTSPSRHWNRFPEMDVHELPSLRAHNRDNGTELHPNWTAIKMKTNFVKLSRHTLKIAKRKSWIIALGEICESHDSSHSIHFSCQHCSRSVIGKFDESKMLQTVTDVKVFCPRHQPSATLLIGCLLEDLVHCRDYRFQKREQTARTHLRIWDQR